MTKKESERRGFGCQLFIQDLRKLVVPMLNKRGFSCVDIIEKWVDIVGTDLNAGVRPEKVSYVGEKGILHVICRGGAYATVVEHRKRLILERVNTFIGRQALYDIRIRQGAFKEVPCENQPILRTLSDVEKQAIEASVSVIGDKDLRATAARLGLAICRRQQK